VTGVVSQNSTNPELSISKLLPPNRGGGGGVGGNFSLISKAIKILAPLNFIFYFRHCFKQYFIKRGSWIDLIKRTKI